ncbi:MAG: hypothetical protein IPL61_04695 [Myxococcales bacterium]|nr:hypothetical protein [Myxococcales bacterium]
MPGSRLLLVLRVLAVGLVGALSWKLLRVDDRTTTGAALAVLEMAALTTVLVWPSRLLTTAALALPLAVAIARQDVVIEVAWAMWSATVIGLANLVRGVAARGQLPDATIRRT